MKNFTLQKLKKLVGDTMQNEPITGDKFLDDRYEEQRKFCGGLTLPYYRVLYQLAKEYKPKLSVELGSFQATAAAHLAGGNPFGGVVTIDIHKDPGQELDKERCDEADEYFSNLHTLVGWTWDEDVIDFVSTFGKSIDILFVDAWHRRDYVEREWEIYEPMLSDKAIVVCDDITNNGGLFENMEEWFKDVKYPKFINDDIHRGVPMGFFIYTRKKGKK